MWEIFVGGIYLASEIFQNKKKKPVHCNLLFIIHQLAQPIYQLLFIEDCFPSQKIVFPQMKTTSSVWFILVSYFQHFSSVKLYI